MKIQNRVHTASGFSLTITESDPLPDATQAVPELNADSNGPGLLSIPPEMRDRIYGHLLPAIQEYRFDRGGKVLDKQFCPPAIARVHPTTRAEILARMYTNLRVCITQTSQTSSFTKWLGKCNMDIIHTIRSIVIIVRIPDGIFSHGALFIELNSDPSINIRWQREVHAASPTFPGNVISAQHQQLLHWYRLKQQRIHRQRVKLLNAAKAAVSQTMESCMPKHPHYDRRVFTQHAFMILKAELWYELGFRQQRETVLDPAAQKAAALRQRRRRR